MCDGGFPLLFILKYEEKLEVDPPLVDDWRGTGATG